MDVLKSKILYEHYLNKRAGCDLSKPFLKCACETMSLYLSDGDAYALATDLFKCGGLARVAGTPPYI